MPEKIEPPTPTDEAELPPRRALSPEQMTTLLRGLRLSKTGLAAILLADMAFAVVLFVLAVGYVMSAWGAAKTGAEVSPELGATYRAVKLLVALVPLLTLWGQRLVFSASSEPARGTLVASATCLGLSVVARLAQNHLALLKEVEGLPLLLGLLGPLLLHVAALLLFMLYLIELSGWLGRPELASHFRRLLMIAPLTGLLLLVGCLLLPAGTVLMAPVAALVITLMAYVSLARAINRLPEQVQGAPPEGRLSATSGVDATPP